MSDAIAIYAAPGPRRVRQSHIEGVIGAWSALTSSLSICGEAEGAVPPLLNCQRSLLLYLALHRALLTYRVTDHPSVPFV
jgi:hypothetical protein